MNRLFGLFVLFFLALLWSTQVFAWEQWDHLDINFWETNPTKEQIVQALYGAPGDLITNYTKSWNTYNGCVISSSNVQTVSSITNVPANTIYILESGDYVVSDKISMGNCSALLASGDVSLRLTNKLSLNYGLLNIDWKNIIVDWLELNWLAVNNTNNDVGIRVASKNESSFFNLRIHDFDVWIYLENANRNNFFDVTVFDNKSHGIEVYKNSDYNIFDHIYVYNNRDWVYLANNTWDIVIWPSNNIVSNAFIFNNDYLWIGVYVWQYNVLNNIYAFNNSRVNVWFRYGSSNTLNNAQLFNSYIGLTLDNFDKLNNVQVFQNDIGIFTHPTYWNNSKYYGRLELSRNYLSNYCRIADLYADVWTCANNSTDLWNNSDLTRGLETDSIAMNLDRDSGNRTSTVFRNCAWTIEPFVAWFDFFGSRFCTDKWKQNYPIGNSVVNFIFGFNSVYQKLSYSYIVSTLGISNLVEYNIGSLIASDSSTTVSVTWSFEVLEFSGVAGNSYLEWDSFVLNQWKAYKVLVHRANYTDENVSFNTQTFDTLYIWDQNDFSPWQEGYEEVYLIPFQSTDRRTVQ